jgi:hypothetical protein
LSDSGRGGSTASQCLPRSQVAGVAS